MANAKRLPSGKWRTRLYVGKDLFGKKKYKSFTADTKKESERLALNYNGATTDLTITQATRQFIDFRSAQISPATLRTYNTLLRNDIILLDKIKLDKFNNLIHQKFIDEISKHHAPKGVRNINGLLVSTLKHFGIQYKEVMLPQKVIPKMNIPTTADVKVVIDYFVSKGDKDMTIACLLASIGTLRRGEVCGLMASDVDRKNCTIYIARSMVRGEGYKLTIKPPKTTESQRLIKLPRFLINMLPTKDRVVSITVDQLTDRFRDAIKKLGLDFTFHSLRHYSASIMHAQNIPTKYIMQRGGWKSEHTLNQIYKNTLNDFEKQFTDKTNTYFDEHFMYLDDTKDDTNL